MKTRKYRPPLTDEEKAAIREALARGELGDDLAAQYGCSPSTIYKYRDPAVPPLGKGRSRQARIREQQLREAYADGLRGAQIDRKYGWTSGSASEIQRRLGLDPAWPPLETAAALYKELGYVNAVARHLGITKYKARAALAAAGVEVERRPGPPLRGPHRLDEHLGAIRELLRDRTVTVIQVAETYGYSYGAMCAYLNSRGVATYQRVDAEGHEKIARLKAAGVPVSVIAERLGVSQHTVYEHLKDKPRPRLRAAAPGCPGQRAR